jgi:hypothetical protein
MQTSLSECQLGIATGGAERRMPGTVYGYGQDGACIWQDNSSGAFYSAPFSRDQTGWVVGEQQEVSRDYVIAQDGTLPPADFFCQSTLQQRSELDGDGTPADFGAPPTFALETDSEVLGTDLIESA